MITGLGVVQRSEGRRRQGALMYLSGPAAFELPAIHATQASQHCSTTTPPLFPPIYPGLFAHS